MTSQHDKAKWWRPRYNLRALLLCCVALGSEAGLSARPIHSWWLGRGEWQRYVDSDGEVVYEHQDLDNGFTRYRVSLNAGFLYWDSDPSEPVEEWCGVGMIE
ncbi:MAG: hypothetical protein H8E66_03005 [Planctomycetes bacterium]|nr:hypothetical protein [Planctomycetota bacterium]